MIDLIAGVIAAAILVFTFVTGLSYLALVAFLVASIPSLIRHRREIFGKRVDRPGIHRLGPADLPNNIRRYDWRAEGCPVCGRPPKGWMFEDGNNTWPRIVFHRNGDRCDTRNFQTMTVTRLRRS